MHNLDTLSWVCRIQGRSLCSLDAAKSLEHRALSLDPGLPIMSESSMISQVTASHSNKLH
jgi:hypothetical protein